MSRDLRKNENEIYCPECGIPIKRGMPSCPYCHSHIRRFVETGEMPEHRTSPSPNSKDKTAAVLLAVFLGYWSWLYTYGRNKTKFWLSFGILSVLYLVIMVYSFSLLISSLTYYGYTEVFFGESLLGLNIFVSILGFGIWVWSIVDNAIKPDSFYQEYPKH